MKKITFFLSLSAMVMFTSCTENQANGERIGMITKFTKSGIIWKSHEAHLNATQTGMNSAEGFDFSVDNDINDPVIIATLDSAASYGWKVKIKYHKTFGYNWFSNRGNTNFFVNEVEVLDRNVTNQLNNNQNNEVVSGKVIDTVYVVIDKSQIK
jgi:hypothetical protein